MTSLPLTTDREETKWQKILAIAKSNNFPVHLITRLKRHTQQKTHTDNTNNKTKKWATAIKSEKSPTFSNGQTSK
jgi:hypothetical protein